MENKYLEDHERDLVIFIEKFHSLAGVPPDTISMIDYLRSIGKETNEAALETIISNPIFQKSMDARGIVIGSTLRAKGLTVRQMTVAAIMTNYIDRRSDAKKLQDLGVSTSEWSGWMLDQDFVNYLQGRTEKILGNSLHEAHLGLIRGVRNGNVPAIKLYYELVDRYNPDKESQINVRQLLGRVIEVIQKHVKDPVAMTNMATELSQIVIEATPRQALQGQVTRRT